MYLEQRLNWVQVPQKLKKSSHIVNSYYIKTKKKKKLDGAMELIKNTVLLCKLFSVRMCQSL